MKVIIDSNILYDNSYSKKLKIEIINLIQECNNLGITIVIPTTVITEVNRKQRELGKKLKEEIKKSINFLKDYQINTEEFDINKIVSDISVVDKFAENKISIEIVEPTLEIYAKAHETAAEHRAPCVKKEDEMRDLIIWEIACEISRKEGGALIISDDKLFWGDQGDEIANEVKLTRVRTVDDALGVLEIGTPARSKAEAILKDIWINLTKPPLPLDNDAKIKRLYDASFIEGDHGTTYASFHASIVNNNEKLMEVDFRIKFLNDRVDVRLSDIIYDGKKFREGGHYFSQKITNTTNVDGSYEEKLAKLRNLIGA